MRGRIPIHAGSGPGLTPRTLGRKAGGENVALTTAQMPAHLHESASSDLATGDTPDGSVLGNSSSTPIYGATGGSAMVDGSNVAIGGSQQHTNLMPFECVTFIIALFGIYPSRN